MTQRELSSLSPLVIAALQRMLLQPARRHRCGSGNGTGGLRERRDRCEELSPYYLSASMELLRQLRLSDMLRPRTHGYHLACSMVTNDLLPCLGPVPSLLRPAAMLHCRRFPRTPSPHLQTIAIGLTFARSPQFLRGSICRGAEGGEGSAPWLVRWRQLSRRTQYVRGVHSECTSLLSNHELPCDGHVCTQNDYRSMIGAHKSHMAACQ